jgi:ribosome maturation factor RimP
MNPDITETIKDLAVPLAEEQGYFVVDVELKTGNGNEVWVYLDGEESAVNVDECAKVSRELGFLMEAHELLGEKYLLNVSSPGLSRPLTDKRQYKKNIERKFRVRYRQDNNEVNKITGILTNVSDTTFEITLDDNKAIEIDFDSVIESKIIPVIK